jgi:hypothetical protein
VNTARWKKSSEKWMSRSITDSMDRKKRLLSVVVELVLLGYILVSHLFFLYATHKFINKIMSHSFYDYQQAVKVGKKEVVKKELLSEEEPEDLGTLQGIGIL